MIYTRACLGRFIMSVILTQAVIIESPPFTLSCAFGLENKCYSLINKEEYLKVGA